MADYLRYLGSRLFDKTWKVRLQSNRMSEEQDLVELHKKCDKIRQTAFSAMNNALRMSQVELKHTGFKTNQDAAMAHFKSAQKEIQDLTTEHLNNYPDIWK